MFKLGLKHSKHYLTRNSPTQIILLGQRIEFMRRGRVCRLTKAYWRPATAGHREQDGEVTRGAWESRLHTAFLHLELGGNGTSICHISVSKCPSPGGKEAVCIMKWPHTVMRPSSNLFTKSASQWRRTTVTLSTSLWLLSGRRKISQRIKKCNKPHLSDAIKCFFSFNGYKRHWKFCFQEVDAEKTPPRRTTQTFTKEGMDQKTARHRNVNVVWFFLCFRQRN